MTWRQIVVREGAGETMQEEAASLPTSTLLFHLVLLVSTKSYRQQCLGGGGQPVTLIPIPPGWVSSESQAPSSQLPATACLYPIDCTHLLAQRTSPHNGLQGWSSAQSESHLGSLPSYSLSPKVFFTVLLTSLLIISDNTLTSPKVFL